MENGWFRNATNFLPDRNERAHDLAMKDSRTIGFGQAMILAAVLSLFAGCTAVTIKSNKDAVSVRQLSRLYIVVNNGDVTDKSLSSYLIEGFKGCLTNSPVQADYGTVSALDLDSTSITEQIKAFHPDGVLVVSVSTFVVSADYGGYPTIIYDASLYDSDRTKRIWRASINNSGGTALMKLRMHQMAGKIATQLQTDGFLSGISVPDSEPKPNGTTHH